MKVQRFYKENFGQNQEKCLLESQIFGESDDE